MKRWGNDRSGDFLVAMLVVAVGLIFLAAVLLLGEGFLAQKKMVDQKVPSSVGNQNQTDGNTDDVVDR